MRRFVHRQNLERFKKLLAEAKDEATREVLRNLLAEEESQEVCPLERATADGKSERPS